MKCNNCGWDNPPGKVKCEKCNVRLEGSMVIRFKPSDSHIKDDEGHITIKDSALPDKQQTVVAKSGGARKIVGFLVSYTLKPEGAVFPLFEGKSVIGRSESADICLKDKQISDPHLTILYRLADRKFTFEDHKTTNGTYLNGRLCAVGEVGELHNGDLIRIGNIELIFTEILIR